MPCFFGAWATPHFGEWERGSRGVSTLAGDPACSLLARDPCTAVPHRMVLNHWAGGQWGIPPNPLLSTEAGLPLVSVCGEGGGFKKGGGGGGPVPPSRHGPARGQLKPGSDSGLKLATTPPYIYLYI